MKFWFDTEFYEDGRTIDLISIGVVAEDGREYYAEQVGARTICRRSAWLMENVYPLLSDVTRLRAEIAHDLVQFVGDAPEFWAYYADYDWVVLCQLYGRMIDLPKGWPMYCRDLKQVIDETGVKPSRQKTGAHNALEDARWVRNAWNYVQGRR